MPDIDPSQIVAVLQEDAKEAKEHLRTFLLAENERWRNENETLHDDLKKLCDDLQKSNVENGRLRMMVDLYQTANWFYISGTVIFAITGLLPKDIPSGLYWSLFGIGAISVGVGIVSWICGLRRKAS